MHLFLLRHRLDGFVVDLAHFLFAGGVLGALGQHHAHQDLVADEGLALLEHGLVAQLVFLGRLRDQNNIGDIGDELLALDFRRRLMRLVAQIVLGDGDVAVPDFDAVDPRDDRIVRIGRASGTGSGRGTILRTAGDGRQDEKSERGQRHIRLPARTRRRAHRWASERCFQGSHGAVLE